MIPLTLKNIVSKWSANGHWVTFWPALVEASFSISSTVWLCIEYFKNRVSLHRKCLYYTKYPVTTLRGNAICRLLVIVNWYGSRWTFGIMAWDVCAPRNVNCLKFIYNFKRWNLCHFLNNRCIQRSLHSWPHTRYASFIDSEYTRTVMAQNYKAAIWLTSWILHFGVFLNALKLQPTMYKAFCVKSYCLNQLWSKCHLNTIECLYNAI